MMKISVFWQTHASIIWPPVFLATICTALENLHISNLDCYNDYLTEMFCTWEVPEATTNCSEDYLLEYNHFPHRASSCAPENKPRSDSRSPNECICYIQAEYFVAADIYDIQLMSRGGHFHDLTIVPANKVKPKTPKNVSMEQGDEEVVIVRWDSGYTAEDYLFQQLVFEVQTSTIQEPKEVTTLQEVESCYIMKKRLFRRRQDYTVKVRSKPNGVDYNGVWSEWSPAAVWHNDYDLQFHDIMVITIPSSAAAIFICLFLCWAASYLCKKRWLSKIPDPGRSQLLFTLMNEPQVSGIKSDTDCNIVPFKGNMMQDKIICPRHILTRDHNLMDRRDVHKIILIPEETFIEKPLDISPLHEDLNSAEESAEDEADDTDCLTLECDVINKMFLELLEGDTEEDKVMEHNRSSFLADFCRTYDTSELVCTSYMNGNLPVTSSLCFGEGNVLRDCSSVQIMEYSCKNNDNNMEYSYKNNDNNMEYSYKNNDNNMEYSYKNNDNNMEYSYKNNDNNMEYSCENIDKNMENSCKNIDNTMEYEPTAYLHTISTRSDILQPVYHQWKPLYTHYHPKAQNDTTKSSKTSPGLNQITDYQSFDTAAQQPSKNVAHINYTTIDTGYKSFQNLLRVHSRELDSQCEIVDTEDLQMRHVLTMYYNNTLQSCVTDEAAMKTHPSPVSEEFSDKPGADCDPRQVVQDSHIVRVPYALTFDISDHMRNLHQISGLTSDHEGARYKPVLVMSFDCTNSRARLEVDFAAWYNPLQMCNIKTIQQY
ncbi:hypothetical protein GDO81_016786 [Engystomops pustulosus]|uniref:Interleukin-4 receptor alpha N-terminal domain-containing protein n=1 Tax=Engystomops pustulosus TaxID=76066 RepID=A0AAV7AIN2_ENGPU|nr:hypothetical protein GDO81_016786 [Engystomops pustulosus]